MPVDLYRPVPKDLPSVVGWKEIPIKECGEALVPLGMFSSYWDIPTFSVYYGQLLNSPYATHPVEEALLTQFVRKSTASQIRTLQTLLPYGHYPLVLDAYRTTPTQQALYDRYLSKLRQKYPSWSEQELSDETQRFVSIPSIDPTKPSPHNTGGAVDLMIIKVPEHIAGDIRRIDQKIVAADKNGDWPTIYQLEMRRDELLRDQGELLPFGVPFDYAGPESAPNYYERLKEKANEVKFGRLSPEKYQVLQSRRLIANVALAAGFELYEEELWHFNSPKSQMGAKTAGLGYAEFGPIQLSPENIAHEVMRRDHYWGTLRMQQGSSGKLWQNLQEAGQVEQIARLVATTTSMINRTNLERPAIIQP